MTHNEIIPKRRKVYTVGDMHYIALDKQAEGEYFVYAHRDGAYTVLKCPPAPVIKEQPIACQGMTPLGGMEK
jgi:hypothetical protein